MSGVKRLHIIVCWEGEHATSQTITEDLPHDVSHTYIVGELISVRVCYQIYLILKWNKIDRI